MKDAVDIIVIGAGIVGASTAMQLLLRGHKVALIDRRDPGEETSFGNGGIIEASSVVPFGVPALKEMPATVAGQNPAARLHLPSAIRQMPWLIDYYRQSQPAARLENGRLLRPLIAASLEEHRAMMQGANADHYLKMTGRVQLFRREKSFHAGAFERLAADALDVPYEIYDADAFREVEPDIAPNFAKAVRWGSSARVTNPGAVTAAYAERFVKNGGRIIKDNIASLEASPENGCKIVGDRETYTASRVVVCAGPWSPRLLAPLGYNFPLGIKRGYHQHYDVADTIDLQHAIVDVDIGYLIMHTENGIRLTTGADFADIDAPPNPKQIAMVLPYARQLLPLGEQHQRAPWTGNRPCFADSLPAIGRAPNHEWLWLNFGHGHLGFTLGPSSARLIAEMMQQETTFCDPAAYRPSRFWD